jgi:hypothetical protein
MTFQISNLNLLHGNCYLSGFSEIMFSFLVKSTYVTIQLFNRGTAIMRELEISECNDGIWPIIILGVSTNFTVSSIRVLLRQHHWHGHTGH